MFSFMLKSGIYLSLYSFVYYAVELIKPINISRNLISGLHCYMNIILSFLYMIGLIDIEGVLSNSLGYFIYDSIWIFYNKIKTDIFEREILIHHIISIYFLNETCKYRSSFNIFLLLLGELSNIFNYPIYHMIHCNKEIKEIFIIRGRMDLVDNVDKMLKGLKVFQILDIVLIRGIIFTILIIFCNNLINNVILYYSLMIIYVMGIYWMIKLIIKFYKEYMMGGVSSRLRANILNIVI